MVATPSSRRFPFRSLAALGLVLFSFFMSGFVSRIVFERLPHLEDEVAYIYQAKTLAGGHLVIDSPQPRRAFWQPFVLDQNDKRFGKYTLGWPALLAPGMAMGEPWVINAFFAALTVALVFRFGSDVYNRDVGLIAASLTAFSPMALLLNATLMGHSSALFFVMLFMFAYWRLERDPHPVRWGIVAGLALGAVIANRPLTGVGVALPFIAWSGVRLLRALRESRVSVWHRLRPLLALSVVAILLSAVIPIYNYAATGDAGQNLYTLVWDYDSVGFGECCGRSADRGEGGHNLERGVRHMRFDLSLMAADLFGWQIGQITPEAETHFLLEGDYYPLVGISWILLPVGLLIAYRRRSIWIALWLLVGYGWLWLIFNVNNAEWARNPTASWLWLGVAALWLVAPLFVLWRAPQPTRATWTWLLVSVALGLIGAQLTYWIGSQRYSTRYYYEALAVLALLSALPVAWLARRFGRIPVYALFAVALLYSLYFYSQPRISALYRYNQISREQIAQVEARREGDRPVLVLVEGGSVRWRAFGTLMSVTSPYLDSDIIAAWDYGATGVRDAILERFPDRQVIEMQANENDWWFEEETVTR